MSMARERRENLLLEEALLVPVLPSDEDLRGLFNTVVPLSPSNFR